MATRTPESIIATAFSDAAIRSRFDPRTYPPIHQGTYALKLAIRVQTALLSSDPGIKDDAPDITDILALQQRHLEAVDGGAPTPGVRARMSADLQLTSENIGGFFVTRYFELREDLFRFASFSGFCAAMLASSEFERLPVRKLFVNWISATRYDPRTVYFGTSVCGHGDPPGAMPREKPYRDAPAFQPDWPFPLPPKWMFWRKLRAGRPLPIDKSL